MPAYKNKERNTWYAAFYYTDWQGTRKKKKKEGFKTQREAKAYERVFLERAQADPDMSFATLVDIYLEDNKTRIKPTTFDNKQYVIKNKILPYFKDLPINEIDAAVVRRWQNELLSDDKDYSPTYLRSLHSHLSAIFNFAVKYYKLNGNPARTCGSIGKDNADSMKFWTRDEFSQFIENVESPVAKIVFVMLFWTGMRVGECLALTLDDINNTADGWAITVDKNYVRLKKEDLILEPKTEKGKRVVTIPDSVYQELIIYIEQLYDYQSHERLFLISKNVLNFELKSAANAAEVKIIRVHDLRHSHASLLIELGFSPVLIAERLGHENVETTLNTYSHLYPNKHGEVAQKLEELMPVTNY
jgi:integrase